MENYRELRHVRNNESLAEKKCAFSLTLDLQKHFPGLNALKKVGNRLLQPKIAC